MCISAVSYTHLDVYKRQGLNRTDKKTKFTSIDNPFSSLLHMPHIRVENHNFQMGGKILFWVDEILLFFQDVYKRQEELLSSERAFSFKMKLDAIRRQGARADLTLGTEFPKLDENSKRTRNQIGMEAGISGRQVTKYIRLTELISTILDLVDSKKITLTMGVEMCIRDSLRAELQ